MMPLFWVMLWSTLPPLALLSGPDHCTIHESSSSQNVSPLLESLQCHNDYESYIHCKWTRTNTPLQLWFQKGKDRHLCKPVAVQHTDENRTIQCRYETRSFSIGIKYNTFFFKNITLTHCSSAPTHVSQHLRARPPVDLSAHDAGDGGWWLKWSSPYPSPSSLSKNLKYQLSYRPQRQDNFTIEDVTSTDMKLRSLLPGYMYEARVRAQASVGQWSEWSPMVTWQTEGDAGQFPSLHCVLDGEKEVMCSWEVSREQAHFITYQLACRYNHTARFDERCCVNPTVTRNLSRSVLRYSCSLAVADPAHLLLKLIMTHNAKTFAPYQHIRPKPPQQVTVRKKDRNWIVEWTEPSRASEVQLCYQVCYNRTQNSSTLVNISGKTMSLTILEASLAPSQFYQVKVRSLVVPGGGSTYKGTPSEWTDPVGFTSHEATWSFTTLIYVSISVFVAVIFFTFYFTIPACQRRVVLWVESVPSPGKSKILSEIKSASNQPLMQSETTYICKVLSLDSLSTCSSDASLWPTKDTEKQHLEQYSGCWKCDNLLSPAEKVNGNDLSSMSFSGPYILCQTSDPNCKLVEAKCEEKGEQKEETSSHDTATPSPVIFALYGDGYVCLPNRNASRSTQDLVFHSDANTSTHRHNNAELDQQCPDNTPRSDKADIQPGISEPTGGHQPAAYTSGPFTPWPQGGTVQASGYCLLPQKPS